MKIYANATLAGARFGKTTLFPLRLFSPVILTTLVKGVGHEYDIISNYQ